MHQKDQHQHGLAVHRGPTKIVQIGDQIYQLSEIQAQPLAVNPQPITQPVPATAPVPYQPHPTVIHPTALPQQESVWTWQTIALIGIGLLIVTGFGTFLIVKAALPPSTAPVVVPPAPAAAPQPIIINQAPPAPPPPPPMPYTERQCEPGGFLGMGQNCTTRQGYR